MGSKGDCSWRFWGNPSRGEMIAGMIAPTLDRWMIMSIKHLPSSKLILPWKHIMVYKYIMSSMDIFQGKPVKLPEGNKVHSRNF